MTTLFVLFTLGLLGVVLIGSILGLTSSGRITKLEQQNKNLSARLKILEAARGMAPPTISEFPEPAAPKPTSEPIPDAEPIEAPAPVPVAVKPVPQPVAASASAPVKTSPDVKTSPATPSWPPQKSGLRKM